MPLSKAGKNTLKKFKKEYGSKKGKSVFYAMESQKRWPMKYYKNPAPITDLFILGATITGIFVIGNYLIKNEGNFFKKIPSVSDQERVDYLRSAKATAYAEGDVDSYLKFQRDLQLLEANI